MDQGATTLDYKLPDLFDGFVPFKASQLYVEDTVLDVSREQRSIGVVERTHEDVDSHVPHPQTDFPGAHIQRGKGVSASAFSRFLRDGVPPKDAVLVRWQGVVPVELALISNVLLVDRALLMGDVVKRNAQSTVSGTVTRVLMTCAAVHTAYENPLSSVIADLPPPHVLRNLPAAELVPPVPYTQGAIIIYNDWVGRVDFVEADVAVKLQNQTVVVVEDPGLLETLSGIVAVEVGEIVHTKKGNLRRGRWIYGAFDANCEPLGQVVDTRPTLLEVTWLAPKPGTSKPQPPDVLDNDALAVDAVQVYDHTRTKGVSAAYNSPDYGPGDYVRFRDLAGAVAKYEDDTTLVRIPRTKTSGYDINTLRIMATHTEVTVRWQDNSTSVQSSTSLIPDLNIDDDDEVWPGEIVLSREVKAGEAEEWSLIPARVGVIQSVTSSDRIAQIRWWRKSNVQYYRDTETPDGGADKPGLMPEPSLEDLDESIEEVSLYDVRPAIGLDKRLGDFVIILPDSGLTQGSDDNSSPAVDWFGEIIHLGTDGIICVRLGLAAEIRDVLVRPEHLILVYGNDMANDFDEEAAAADGYSDEHDDMDEEGGVGSYDWAQDGLPEDMVLTADGRSDTSAEYHETMEYQGNGGERMESDGGEDAWSTESESDGLDKADTPMTDVKPSPTLTPSKEQNEPLSRSTDGSDPTRVDLESAHSLSLGISGHPNAPHPFAVLEEPVPSGHHYHHTQQSTSNTNLRRITKEQKILRKEGALPEGVFVRTWESRLDLLRILFIGPLDTPYMFAPFIIDMHLAQDFPRNPPQVFFHSWTNGSGPVNPNLYEDGKVCLSLLGTWSGEPTESWDPEKSTILQILVSLLGLVLVKEPYFNEAGFEVRVGSEDAKIPSALYSERTYLRTRAFIVHALKNEIAGFKDEIEWLYRSSEPEAPMMLDRAVEAAKRVIATSESEKAKMLEKDGISVISAGAIVRLKRQIPELQACSRGDAS